MLKYLNCVSMQIFFTCNKNLPGSSSSALAPGLLCVCNIIGGSRVIKAGMKSHSPWCRIFLWSQHQMKLNSVISWHFYDDFDLIVVTKLIHTLVAQVSLAVQASKNGSRPTCINAQFIAKYYPWGGPSAGQKWQQRQIFFSIFHSVHFRTVFEKNFLVHH